MDDRSRIRGFTLIEMMIALALMAIVTAQVLMLFTTQHKVYVVQDRTLEVQQNARLVTGLVLADIRMAGFLVPAIAGIASVDGGPNDTDILCTSDPSVMAESEITDANGRFDRARLQLALGGNAGSVTLVASTMDLDGDTNDDFAANRGIIISDGANSHCARIEAVGGNVVSFTPDTPAGFNAGTADSRAVPAVVYEIAAGDLLRNGAPLAPGIENLQVEFGVDADGDRQIETGTVPPEFPVHDLIGWDPSEIRSVRLSVIARAPSEDPEFTGTGMPAAGNHVAGAADGFVRRRFTSTVYPRNLR